MEAAFAVCGGGFMVQLCSVVARFCAPLLGFARFCARWRAWVRGANGDFRIDASDLRTNAACVGSPGAADDSVDASARIMGAAGVAWNLTWTAPPGGAVAGTGPLALMVRLSRGARSGLCAQ